MSMLVFTSEEALHLALTSGLVPAEVQAAPARYHRTSDGALHVLPEVMPAKEVLAHLASLGVQVTRSHSKEATPVLCWAELVTARRVPLESAPTGPVLFLPPSADALLPLAGEMLRLGCDRQEVCFAQASGGSGQRALLRAMAPPYFTVTSALDAAGPLRAFVPAVPGQHAVWVEVGYTHPLARTLQAPAGTLLLVRGEGPWLTAPDGPWTDLYQHTDLRLPTPGEDWMPAPPRAG
ncbi:hypothetical protein QEG98_15470 [Myxococcus sp. MxC21-1]|nr:hypothetical protein [Myxococcus sp. MxC21-1]WNZ64917.1 hypothetical protein QEG98_15470 [Myxococcus sp. MxC21-1]